MKFTYNGLPPEICRSLRNGAPDANGQTAERSISDGGGNPCRCCLNEISAGDEMLILAYRPFETQNPYAETGPIFLCADCAEYQDYNFPPPVFVNRPRHSMKGYSRDERIVYGTGEIVETVEIETYLKTTFSDERVDFVHVRSAVNGCFTLRIDRIIGG